MSLTIEGTIVKIEGPRSETHEDRVENILVVLFNFFSFIIDLAFAIFALILGQNHEFGSSARRGNEREMTWYLTLQDATGKQSLLRQIGETVDMRGFSLGDHVTVRGYHHMGIITIEGGVNHTTNRRIRLIHRRRQMWRRIRLAIGVSIFGGAVIWCVVSSQLN